MTSATTPQPTATERGKRTLWQIDPNHSSVEFIVRHMMITDVRGKLGDVTGTLEVDEENLANSRVHAQIDLTKLDTGNPDRDMHLRSADFFGVEKYPTITFESTEIEPLREHTYCLVGDLTLHGVTRRVELTMDYQGRAVDPWGKHRMGFSATATVNRKDFGLNWNVALEAGGVLVGDRVTVNISVSAVKVDE